MKLDKSHITSGIVGAIIGACSVMGINALSDNDNVISSFFDSKSHKGKASMYDRVEADTDGDVFITTKGRKYHRGSCYILRQSDEVKQATRSDVIDVGYEPCKKNADRELLNLKLDDEQTYLILAALMLLCLAPMPYGYFQLVRFVAMVAFGLMAYRYYVNNKTIAAVVFGVLALLFSPSTRLYWDGRRGM